MCCVRFIKDVAETQSLPIVISRGGRSQDVVSFVEVRADKAAGQSFNRGGLSRLKDNWYSSWTLLQKQATDMS